MATSWKQAGRGAGFLLGSIALPLAAGAGLSACRMVYRHILEQRQAA